VAFSGTFAGCAGGAGWAGATAGRRTGSTMIRRAGSVDPARMLVTLVSLDV
jgi:hypothetical protein